MSEPAVVTMEVRQAGGAVAVVDIKGEVTAACEPVLMSAYEEATAAARPGWCSTSPGWST